MVQVAPYGGLFPHMDIPLSMQKGGNGALRHCSSHCPQKEIGGFQKIRLRARWNSRCVQHCPQLCSRSEIWTESKIAGICTSSIWLSSGSHTTRGPQTIEAGILKGEEQQREKAVLSLRKITIHILQELHFLMDP